jgi:hypothetical protein
MSMRRSVSFIAVTLLILVTSAVAGEVTVGPFSVSLPSTFVGPERAAPDANTEMVAYSSPRKQGEPANVIQFTRYAVGTAPPNADDNTYAEGAEHYLQQMLQGVARRRTAYVQSPLKRARLAGHVGASASWTGAVQGFPTNGVMYCAIIGSDAWFIHVFGPGDRPDSELQLVIGAVERSKH